ncbi:MAG: hypothetical protein Q9217_006081 [Psora testacea]
MLLDYLIPSSRRPEASRGNRYDLTASFGNRASTAKTSGDNGTHTVVESTSKSLIPPEDASRRLNPVEDNEILSNLTTIGKTAQEAGQRRRATGKILAPSGEQFLLTEIESEQRHKRKMTMASDFDQKEPREGLKMGPLPMQPPPHGAEQQHNARKRRKQRDLATVEVKDMSTENRYGRIRILRGRIERGGQLNELERVQLAELEGNGTRTKLRDLSKFSVADMDRKTKKYRRDTLHRKVRSGKALNDLEKVQWAELSHRK